MTQTTNQECMVKQLKQIEREITAKYDHDVFQDVCVRLLRQKGFDWSRDNGPLVWQAAKQASIDRYRRARHMTSACSIDSVASPDKGSGHDPINNAIETEAAELVQSKVRALPPKYRNVVLSSLGGATPQQIASSENVSVETVKTRLRRAKQILRNDLQLQSLAESSLVA